MNFSFFCKSKKNLSITFIVTAAFIAACDGGIKKAEGVLQIELANEDITKLKTYSDAIAEGALWAKDNDEIVSTVMKAFKVDPEAYGGLFKAVDASGTEQVLDGSKFTLYNNYWFSSQSSLVVQNTYMINKNSLYDETKASQTKSQTILLVKTDEGHYFDTHYRHRIFQQSVTQKLIKKKYLWSDVNKGAIGYIKLSTADLIIAQPVGTVEYKGEGMAKSIRYNPNTESIPYVRQNKLGPLTFKVTFDGTANPSVSLPVEFVPNYWASKSWGGYFSYFAFNIKSSPESTEDIANNSNPIDAEGEIAEGIHFFNSNGIVVTNYKNPIYKSNIVFGGPNLEEVGISLHFELLDNQPPRSGADKYDFAFVGTKKEIYDALLAE